MVHDVAGISYAFAARNKSRGERLMHVWSAFQVIHSVERNSCRMQSDRELVGLAVLLFFFCRIPAPPSSVITYTDLMAEGE